MSDLKLRVAAAAAPVRRQLIESLRQEVLNFRFKPGDRLIERELCELTGVSRTSLREALRQLEAEGLITIVPNKGPVVASVEVEEAAHIYEFRALLEGFVGQRFALQATDKEIAALRKSLDAFRKAVRKNDPRELVAAKSGFYDILIAGASNTVIERSLRNLHTRVTLLRAVSMGQRGRIKKSLAELEEIVGAITRRDPDAARKACIEHVENAAEIALGVLRSRNWMPAEKPATKVG
jgi:DNA-binding GntR family transcriptional regulator